MRMQPHFKQQTTIQVVHNFIDEDRGVLRRGHSSTRFTGGNFDFINFVNLFTPLVLKQKLQQNLQYLCEEFVQLVPLKGTTTGADILKDVLECLEENKLDLKEAPLTIIYICKRL